VTRNLGNGVLFFRCDVVLLSL